MKAMFAVLVVSLALAHSAAAHSFCESGNVTTIYPDTLDPGIFSVLESVRPGTVPNGLFYYVVGGATCGEPATVVAEDGTEQIGPFTYPQFQLHDCGVVTMDWGDPGEGFLYCEG